MASETLVNQLVINILTEEQYQDALANNEIQDDQLYMTPSEFTISDEVEGIKEYCKEYIDTEILGGAS